MDLDIMVRLDVNKKSELSILGCCVPCTSILSGGLSHISDSGRKETLRHMSQEADVQLSDPEVDSEVEALKTRPRG